MVSFPVADPVLLVFVCINGHGKGDLFEIGETGNGAGFCTGLRKGGEQHGGENRDDGDDDEEFDQREMLLFHVGFLCDERVKKTNTLDFYLV